MAQHFRNLEGGTVTKKLRKLLLDTAAWTRDVAVVIAGHCSGVVRVRGSIPNKGVNAGNEALFRDQEGVVARKAVDTFLCLQRENPAAAEKFLGRYFAKADVFELSLLDSAGFPLSDAGMLEALVADLMSRANNDFDFDSTFDSTCGYDIGNFRRFGVRAVKVDVGGPQSVSGKYTLSDLECCLNKMSTSKKCLRICFHVVTSRNRSMRELTLALANFSLHVGLTSSLWSLRQFAHIRKCGPSVVRSIKCLRPVSLVSDMAHVVDGLWIARNRQVLEHYAGPCQLGGVSSAVLLVLALVILAQVRDHFGLATFLVALDLRWAFDVAPLNSMRLACMEAGMSLEGWLFLDDVLASDRQCVQLHGLLSAIFTLGAGTAQGRRFSVHVFNSMLSWLAEEIKTAVPHGICLKAPVQLAEALQSQLRQDPPTDWISRASRPEVLEHTARFFSNLLQSPQDSSLTGVISEVLSAFPKQADRAALVEYFGSPRFHAFQYVDDTVVPCASQGDVAAIVNSHKTSACSQYALKTRSKFHYGPSKTCCLPLLNYPKVDADGIDCAVVAQKLILGVLVDSGLSFKPLLKAAMAQGWSSFLAFYHAAESGGFSLPILASQTEARIVSKLRHLAPFLFMVPGAFHTLNRLQWRWGKLLLGIQDHVEARHALVIAQCGWDLSLGAQMAVEVGMTLARIQLLPANHPLAVMISERQLLTAHTWWEQARDWLSSLQLPGELPSIF